MPMAAYSAFALSGCASVEPVASAHLADTEVSAAIERWVTPIASGETLGKTPGVLTLPEAVHSCVFNNLKIQVGAEKIHQARADLWTDSLIPNSQLTVDTQFIPLQRTDINNQGGPPQYDANFSIPLDWCLFGKRVAAMEASRLGIEVAAADFAELIRQKVTDTVVAYYDLMEAKELTKLAKLDLVDLERIEGIVQKQVAAGGAGAIENDRIRLAVLDAQREARKRNAAVESAKAKLRPMVGLRSDVGEFDIQGSLAITAAAKAPELEQAWALAQQNRPNLISDQRSIRQAEAAIEREKRKAKAQVSLAPGVSYQDQQRITGFRNYTGANLALTTSLPFTDRNQGNIAKAESTLRQSQLTLQADSADARAEIEQAVVDYRNAVTAVSTEDPATLIAAKSLRDRTEAAYKTGGRSLLELLDAQRAHRDRVRATISNQADFWRSLNKLQGTIGIRALP